MPPVNSVFSLNVREMVCDLREVWLFLCSLSSGATEVFLILVIFYLKKIWSDPVLAIIKFLSYVDSNLAKYLFFSHIAL